MDIQELKILQSNALENLNLVSEAIRILTQNNPLILFENVVDSEPKDNEIEQDDLYELPCGFYLDEEYKYYVEGVVKEVDDGNVTLFMTNVDFGENRIVDISDLPFHSQVELLGIILKRME